MSNLNLNKKKWSLILAISLFVILGAGLGMVWSQKVQEQGQLKDKLSLTQSRLNEGAGVLPQLSSQKETLQNSLTQISSQIITAKAGLFEEIETIEVDQRLFTIAETSGVGITGVTSSAPTKKNLEGTPCYALQSNLLIEGNLDSVLDFLRNWTEEFPTGVVESIRITTLAAGEEISSASASITLLIYTYSGD